MSVDYDTLLGSNDWRNGVHDCRHYTMYDDPWLVIHRESGSVKGCKSRDIARETYRLIVEAWNERKAVEVSEDQPPEKESENE